MLIQRLTLTLLILGIGAATVPAQDVVRRLTQEEAVKAAVSNPQPEYPPVARQLRIQGRIELEISIDTSGAVDNVKVVSGNLALTGPATNTVKRWKFQPILADGKPVRAQAAFSFMFKM